MNSAEKHRDIMDVGVLQMFEKNLCDDRYEILDSLGHGSWGDVFRAFDRVRSHEVAIKFLRDPAGYDVLADRFFHNEFRAMAKIEHANIVQVYDFGQSPEGIRYYTMAIVHGDPLTKYKGKLKGELLRNVVEDLCRALSAVHAKGCLHCDIKPDNIMLSVSEGQPKAVLMDFGLNIRMSSNSKASPRGTILYAAPEVFAGQQIDVRADIYSLGITLLEVISGVLPFRKEDLSLPLGSKEASRMIVDAAAKIEPPYGNVIGQMTAADPRDRLPSARDVLVALSTQGADEIELPAVPPVPRRLLQPDLIGRKAHLQAIRSKIDELGMGVGGCVLINGAKACGKTRLLKEVRHHAQLSGVTVIGTPDDPAFAHGHSILSSLERSVNLEILDQGGAFRGERLLDRIVELARKRRLLIILDDVQDFGPPDLAVWRSLAHQAALEGFLVVSAMRTSKRITKDALGDFVKVIADEASSVVVELQSLTVEEVSDLCRSMLGTDDNMESVARTLCSETGGNVGACVELLKELAKNERLQHRLGHWSIAPEPLVQESDAGRAQHPAVRPQTAPSNLKTVLLAAAINGLRAPATFVLRIAGLPPGKFAELVRQLERAGILEWEMVGSQAFIRFIDHSYPKVVLERSDPAQLSSLSSAAADILLASRSQGGAFDPFQLVEHLKRAGRVKELIEVATAEGKRHRSAAELPLGIGLLRAALSAVESLPSFNVFRSAGLRMALSRMMFRQGEASQALEQCLTALKQLQEKGLSGDNGNLFLAIQMHGLAGKIHENLSSYSSAIEHHKAALVLLQPLSGISRYRTSWVNVQNSLGWAQMLAHDYPASEKTVNGLLAQIDESSFPHGMIRALSTAGWLALYKGNPRKALDLFERGIDIASKSNLPAGVKSQSVNGAASASWFLGNWTDSLSYYQEASQLVDGLQDPSRRSSAIGNLAVAEYQLGRLGSAEAHFREGLALDVEMGDVEGYVVALNNLGTLLTAQNRNAEARKYLEKALWISRDRHFSQHALMVEQNIGEVLMNEREFAQAKRLLQGALRRARRNGEVGILPEAYRRMARLSLEQGSYRSFNIYARKAREAAESIGEKLEVNHIDRLLARFHAANDRPKQAEDLFLRAADAFGSGGARFEEALTKLEWAELCLEHGRLSRAGELAGEVEGVLKEAGAIGALDRFKHLQKQIARGRGWPEKVRSVLEAFDGLKAAPDMEKALEVVARALVSITGADRGVVIGLNQRGMAQFEASANMDGIHNEYLRVSASILRHVTKTREALFIDSAATDPRFANSDSIAGLQIGSVVCVPVSVHSDLRAVLYMDSKTPHLFDEQEHLPLAQLMAHHVGLFLENARIVNENELVEELVASLAHEMRTPLNAILSSVELMAVRTKRPPSHYVGVVGSQVARLSRLADETIDLIKGKSSSRLLCPQRIDVNALITHVAETLDSLARKSKIALKLSLAKGLTEIVGQRDALEQVLINLLTNAPKHTGPGGTITIRTQLSSMIGGPSRPDSSYLYLGQHAYRADGSFITISVIDDGEGMEEAECKRIFEKYARTTKTEANHRIKGSGLGLYICRSIIEQHGGRIWATSRKGKGSKLTFTLPVAPKPELQKETQSTRPDETL
ncbi:MAG: protein kinase [Candidatus Coatesbacteria bacterium]|nr:protein kinase [Candidatus Coatesbacteria bacterium]